MENKTKTIALIFTLYTALFAGYELWGPVSVVGDSAEAAVLRLGHTPAAALQPDSILVKLPDSTIGTYPLSAAMSDSVPWDFITDKPDSFQSKNHNHPISDVNNLIDSLNKKYNTADTNKLQQKITGAATTVTSNNLTVSSALISNSSGKIAVSPVTSAELGYLDGVTSNIQTQIGSKSDTSHNHALSDVTGLNGALAGKEPTITGSTEGKFWNGLKQWVNITIGNVLGLNDTITNHRTAIASKLNSSDTSSLARKNHGHSQSQITGLVDTVTAHRNAINNKQPLDTDLTAIAGLTHGNRRVIISDGSTWTRRALVAGDIPYLPAEKITSGTLDNARLSFNPNYFVQGINSRRSVILGSASPLDSNKHSTFFTMYSSDPTYDSRLSGHGIGFRSQHGENDGYALDMIGNTYGDGTLLFGGVYNNVRQPWRAIWHEGNFNPADYQPLNTYLTAIAGLTPTAKNVIIGTGTTWTRRALAEADLPSLSISKITGLQSVLDSKSNTSHTHAIADVTSLQTALDGKLDNRGVSIASFDDMGPNTNRGITIFSSGFNKSGQPLGASYWSGFEFRHNIVEDYRSQIAMGTTGITPQLAIRNKTNGVWGSWYKVWHDGNFNPANYQSAITGTANKVLSIQADGSGVKTGSIYDDGNVALIGKTTATGGGDYKLEVEGNALISGTLTAGWVTAASGADITTLQIHDKIQIKNTSGTGWLNFVKRDVSGSEAVADLSNVGSISMISPSTNNTMNLYVDNSRSAAGINAQTGLLEIRNTSTATNGDILIQSVASDINISSIGESGEISLDAKRVKISRRNLKSQTFTYTVNGSYIIDLNNYYDVNLFIINSTATWVSIGFKNATVGDEIHVNIKGYGAVAYQRDPNSGNAWYEWPNDPIKLDEFFYKLICTGTDDYYGQTINTWIIGL